MREQLEEDEEEYKADFKSKTMYSKIRKHERQMTFNFQEDPQEETKEEPETAANEETYVEQPQYPAMDFGFGIFGGGFAQQFEQEQQVSALESQMNNLQADVSSYRHGGHQTYNPYYEASQDDVTSRYEALFQDDAMDVYRKRQTSYRPNRSFHDVEHYSNYNQGYAEGVQQTNSFMVGH